MKSVASTPNAVPEARESLWRLVVSPTIWAAHFLCSYVTAAVYCAKYAGGREGSLTVVRWAIVGFTIAALVGIGLNGWAGRRRYRLGREPPPFDSDTPEDRHRFMGFATLLLAGLSFVATVFSALVVLFFHDCR